MTRESLQQVRPLLDSVRRILEVEAIELRTSNNKATLHLADSIFERTSDEVETEDLQEVVDEEEVTDSDDFNLNELRELLSRLEFKIAKYNESRKFWDSEYYDTRESDREVFRDLESRAFKVRKIIERIKSKGSSHKTTDSIEDWLLDFNDSKGLSPQDLENKLRALASKYDEVSKKYETIRKKYTIYNEPLHIRRDEDRELSSISRRMRMLDPTGATIRRLFSRSYF